MFKGIQIVTVAEGTVIEHNGNFLTVTEKSAVRKERTIYVTAKQAAVIKDYAAKNPTKD